MNALAIGSAEISLTFIELGIIIIGLAALARIASRLGFSAIPLYLLAGLAFGTGGLIPLRFGEEFVRVGAEVGVALLLFMLGLEYTGGRLVETLRTRYPSGLLDLALNFTPGVAAGALMGMPPLASILLGGVTYISSSGVVAKTLSDLGPRSALCAPTVVTLLVLEDLAMAVFLPVMAVLLTGRGLQDSVVSVLGAVAVVAAVLWFGVKLGPKLSNFVAGQSDEIVLLSTLGLVLLVAGITQMLQVSAAVGAFLVGVAISGPLAQRAERLMSPLRDLFAATFFLFFGLQIDPATLSPALPAACALALVTAATKLLTGRLAGRLDGLSPKASTLAGATLIARGEFSIVIGGLGAGVESRLGPLSAAYVVILAVSAPVVARLVAGKPDKVLQ
jgi:CPA2 family monovalent cation:H+ antiporter-2